MTTGFENVVVAWTRCSRRHLLDVARLHFWILEGVQTCVTKGDGGIRLRKIEDEPSDGLIRFFGRSRSTLNTCAGLHPAPLPSFSSKDWIFFFLATPTCNEVAIKKSYGVILPRMAGSKVIALLLCQDMWMLMR